MNDPQRSPRTDTTAISTPVPVAETTPPPPSERRGRLLRWAPALLIGLVAATPLLAQAAPSDDELIAGAEAYNAVCSACHQPGGTGVSGQFPPLVNNPNVDDAEYIRTVIHDGLEGEITVNGETYDGVMPPQTVSDADTEAIVVYIQSGFASPSAPAPEIDTGPTAGTQLPGAADLVILAAFLIALVAGAFVLAPRVFSVCDRRTLSWWDASARTAVIVIGMILVTTIIPARVIESGAVRDLSREIQDLITLGLWSVGLFGGLWVLWWAHRESRI